MRKTLIIVDMQNDFITGPLGTPEAIEVEKNIAENLDFSIFDKIIFTQDTHFPSYLESQEGKQLPIPHCIIATSGWELSSKIQGKVIKSHVPYDIRSKYTFGYEWYYYSTQVQVEDEFTIVGVCTDICVITNALILKTVYLENPIEVISNMCAGTTPRNHRKALDIMRSCQIKIKDDIYEQ